MCNKFQALKRTYKNLIADNGKSGNDREEWEYFDKMDEMFKNKPWVKPLTIAGSNIPVVEQSISTSSNQSATRKAKVDAALLQYMKDTTEYRQLRRENQMARYREKLNAFNELKDIFRVSSYHENSGIMDFSWNLIFFGKDLEISGNFRMYLEICLHKRIRVCSESPFLHFVS
ncbi:uncharacterized protein LOC105685955 [Athalia rosae]|uniref:uncharacterized protein LOC105685955 n=1 Tax=Athalia rosae TaxID=37344 RepID=UPI002033A4F4|nr:uncharacterized protein LOC105685955 [Athalia rosae]XP_048511785.1 uncharacterized protein LOC105685955 [Athalia rosae]